MDFKGSPGYTHCGLVGTLPKAALWGEKWHTLSLHHGVCPPSEGLREAFISGPRARKNFCESALFLACGQRTLFALAIRKLSSKSVRASSGVACTLGSNPAPPSFPHCLDFFVEVLFIVLWVSLSQWFSAWLLCFVGIAWGVAFFFFFLNASVRAPLPSVLIVLGGGLSPSMFPKLPRDSHV